MAGKHSVTRQRRGSMVAVVALSAMVVTTGYAAAAPADPPGACRSLVHATVANPQYPQNTAAQRDLVRLNILRYCTPTQSAPAAPAPVADQPVVASPLPEAPAPVVQGSNEAVAVTH